mmetsp:Transcript_137165/g.236756  ORF Transcript_137165/g.236756 Transcript_137165/m.236756 type:complete len:1494 (-) Transcript_137165:51-4532(-)
MSIVGGVGQTSDRRTITRSSSKSHVGRPSSKMVGRQSSKSITGMSGMAETPRNDNGMSSMKASDLIARRKNHEEMVALSKGLVQGIEELEKGGTYRGYDYRPDQEDDDDGGDFQFFAGASERATGSSPAAGPTSAAGKAKELQRREAPVISSQRAALVEEEYEASKPAEDEEEAEEAEEGSDGNDDSDSENSFLEYEARELEEAIVNDSIDGRITNARIAVKAADQALVKLNAHERYRVAHSLNIWFQGSLVGCDDRLEKLREQEEQHGEIFRLCDESLDGVRASLSKGEMDSLCKLNEFGAKLREHGSGRKIKMQIEAERELMEGDPDDTGRRYIPYKMGIEDQYKTIDSTIAALKAQLGDAQKEISEIEGNSTEGKNMPKASDLLQIISDQQEQVRQLQVRQQLFEDKIRIAEVCKGIALQTVSRKSDVGNLVPMAMVDAVYDLLKDVKDSVKQKQLVKKMQEDDDLKYQLLDGEDVRGKPEDVSAKDFYKQQADRHNFLESECNDLNAVIAHLKQLRESDAYAAALTESIEKAMSAASSVGAVPGGPGDDGMTKGTNPFGAGGMGAILFGGSGFSSRASQEAQSAMMSKLINSAEGVVDQLMKEKQRLFPNVVQAAKDKAAADTSAASDSQTAKRFHQSQSAGGSEAVAGNAGGATASSAPGAATSDASKAVSGAAGEAKPEPKAEPKAELKRGRRARQQQQNEAAAAAEGPLASAEAGAPSAAGTKAEDAPQRSAAAQSQVQSEAAKPGSSGQKQEGKSWAQAGAQKAKEKKGKKGAGASSAAGGAGTTATAGAEAETAAPVSIGPPVTDEDLSACEEEHDSAKANLERLQSEWGAMSSETARLEARLAELKERGMPSTSPINEPSTTEAPPVASEEVAAIQPLDVDTGTSEALSTALLELDDMVEGNQGLRNLIEELEERMARLTERMVHTPDPGLSGGNPSHQSSLELKRPAAIATPAQSKTPTSDAAPSSPKTPASPFGVSKAANKFKKNKKTLKRSGTTSSQLQDEGHQEAAESGSKPQTNASEVPRTAGTAQNTTGGDGLHIEEHHEEQGSSVLNLFAKRPKGKGNKLLDVCKSALKAKKLELYEKDIEEIFHLHEDAQKLHEELEVIERQIKAVKNPGGQSQGEILKMFQQDKDAQTKKTAEEVPEKILELRSAVSKKQHELKKLRQIWWQKKPKNGKMAGGGGSGGAAAGAHASTAQNRWDMVRQNQGLTLMDRVLGRLAAGPNQGDPYHSPQVQPDFDEGMRRPSKERRPSKAALESGEFGLRPGILDKIKQMQADKAGNEQSGEAGESPQSSPRGMQVVRSGGFKVKLKAVAAMARGTEVATAKLPEAAPHRRASLADLLASQGAEGAVTTTSHAFEHAPPGGLSENGPAVFPTRTPRKSMALSGPHSLAFKPGSSRASGSDKSRKSSKTNSTANQWFEAVKVAVAPASERPSSRPPSARLSTSGQAPSGHAPAPEPAPAAEPAPATEPAQEETKAEEEV